MLPWGAWSWARQTRSCRFIIGVSLSLAITGTLLTQVFSYRPFPSSFRAFTVKPRPKGPSPSAEQVELEYNHLVDRHNLMMKIAGLVPIKNINEYADCFQVVLDLDRFEQKLSWIELRRDLVAKYEDLARSHRDDLFHRLFPYISRKGDERRTFDSLLATYTRPRGIVVPCANGHFTYALHLISILKKVHNTPLPILVVHAGPDDLTAERRAAFRSISRDVDTLDILDFFDESYAGLRQGGWAIKPFAILASPFRETILCDADAVFMQDPAILLRDPGYERTGTLFFRDREIFPGAQNVHHWFDQMMIGRKPSEMLKKSRWYTQRASREEQESGVVVIHKGKREVALGMVFVGWLNSRAVREAVTYKETFGDKESYWIGFELAGIPYYLDPPYADTIGQLSHKQIGEGLEPRLCSEHHLHLDRKGRPLWWNGSILNNKRKKGSSYFPATHFTHGTADWDCDPDPWCMRSINERSVRRLDEVYTDAGVGFDRVFSDMLGAALVAELKVRAGETEGG